MTDTGTFELTAEELAEDAAHDAAVARALNHTDTTPHLVTWERYEDTHDWLQAFTDGHGTEDDQAKARAAIAELDTTALDALAASRALIELLMERRWYVIQDAREAGASWTEIGAALGMTKQGAHDWYRRAIARRAEIDERHDAERAQRAL